MENEKLNKINEQILAILEPYSSFRDIKDIDLLDKLLVLVDDSSYYSRKIYELSRGLFMFEMYPPPPPSLEHTLISNHIFSLSAPNFQKKIIFAGDEIVNGYKLYPCKVHIFSYPHFRELLELWNMPDMSKDEFIKKYNNIACSDWAKMDEHGECYGGYWKCPEDSEERKNAYDLTHSKNGECLWNLPYPKHFILNTIKIGCGNRMESVRYSNFLCEWMRIKVNDMSN